jgi:uncharacterized phage protein (TIGR01671 family)
MREIKFRAFQKGHKWSRMIYVESITWENGKIESVEGKNKNGACTWWVDDEEQIDLMQYTGLKDKNDKEIYEGDIVQWLSLILPITINDFHSYQFMFGKDVLYKDYAVHGEIIGNIYESLELLNN